MKLSLDKLFTSAQQQDIVRMVAESNGNMPVLADRLTKYFAPLAPCFAVYGIAVDEMVGMVLISAVTAYSLRLRAACQTALHVNGHSADFDTGIINRVNLN